MSVREHSFRDKMANVPPIKPRHLEILNDIVREYIETGEPVGSRTISKQRSHALSPATIRNAMADLADEGYLSQPHTSAGRVPTEKAFRYYVRSLTAGRIPASDSAPPRPEFSARSQAGAQP